jgi:hypothetical protein
MTNEAKRITLELDPLISDTLDTWSKTRPFTTDRSTLIRDMIYTAIVYRDVHDLLQAPSYPRGKGAMHVPGWRLLQLAPESYRSVQIDEHGILKPGEYERVHKDG